MKPLEILLYHCPNEGCEGHLHYDFRSATNKESTIWCCCVCKSRFNLSFTPFEEEKQEPIKKEKLNKDKKIIKNKPKKVKSGNKNGTKKSKRKK